MKRLFPLLLGSLAYCATAQAAAPLAGDTLRGQHQFIQTVSATMCERLEEEGKAKPLNSFSTVEAQLTISRITESSIQAHTEELGELMAANKISLPRKVRERLGENIVVHLLESCPAGQQLLMGIVQNQFGAKLSISAEEKPVLLVVSNDICQRLDADNASRPMASRTSKERMDAFAAAMQGGMLKNMEPLANFYGLDNMQKSKVSAALGQKIALLISQQCPSYILRLGLDAMTSRK
ncbi:hypothetical protein [Hymenobacter cellulosivorans]|uniref:DUF4197 domain-containing protein n=1 Tax=Hymenobacter cellulosivorans TaxID=2932249 RepID=A0ABY4FBB1_9BACT|nr:hypothetical protein [Hymenobacter cellulosivorans]UOQ53794.1 hypothetical protein MUN80_03305 [Hymenobacter cellulosivorans]